MRCGGAGEGAHRAPATPSRSCRRSASAARPARRPFAIYRALRAVNPSPYMFLLDLGGHQLVGVLARDARPRSTATAPASCGRSPARARAAHDREQDDALAAELMARREGARRARDAGRPGAQRPRPRLRAGHRAGRAATWRSSATRTSCTSSRRSTGSCADDRDAAALLRATFPAGTVSRRAQGAGDADHLASSRARRRGVYAGAVGYIGFGGDMDTCIAIRTIVMRDGVGVPAGRRRHRGRLRSRERSTTSA